MLGKAFSSPTSSLRVARTSLPSRRSIGPIRYLNVHEYISMEIMNKYGIATPAGFVASTPEEAETIFKTQMNIREFFFLQ